MRHSNIWSNLTYKVPISHSTHDLQPVLGPNRRTAPASPPHLRAAGRGCGLVDAFVARRSFPLPPPAHARVLVARLRASPPPTSWGLLVGAARLFSPLVLPLALLDVPLVCRSAPVPARRAPFFSC